MFCITNINIAIKASQITEIFQNRIFFVQIIIKPHCPTWIKFWHQGQVTNNAFKVAFLFANIRVNIGIEREANNFLVRTTMKSIITTSGLVVTQV